MMADLRVITAEPPGGNVVAVLEDALAMARAGQLSSVAIAMVDREGVTQHVASKAPSVSLLIGAVSRLLHRLNTSLD